MATPRWPMCSPWFVGLVVVPDLVAGARIDGPDVVGNGEVQDSIDQQRRRLDRRGWSVWKAQASARFFTFCGVIWVSEL